MPEIKQRGNVLGLSPDQIAEALESGSLAKYAADKAGMKLTDAQLSRADLKTMEAEEINKARLDGRLDDLLSGKDGGQ